MQVTVVLTSNGRSGLLRRTIDSFNKFNTFPVTDFIIIDDSGDYMFHKQLKRDYPYHIIGNLKKAGQVASIDMAYSEVKTPYIFHCEDDWEFLRPGFIENSLKVMDNEPGIMTIWLNHMHELPADPIDYNVEGITYNLLTTNFYGWHGFTFNPGLRRMKDYRKVRPYSKHGNTGLAEQAIGQEYYDLGYLAAIFKEDYCKHIG